MGFKGKATSGQGGEFRELPPAGNLPAALIGIIDLGTQDVSYGDKEEKAPKIMLVWELVGEPVQGKEGRNHVIGRDYRLSYHVKSGLRQLYEQWIGRKFGEDEEVDYAARIAYPCLLTVTHGKSKEGNDYAKVTSCGPLPKGMTPVAPKIQPFTWSLTDGLMLRDPKTKKLEPCNNADLPEWEWLPFVYGTSIHETIAASDEWKEMHGGVPSNYKPGQPKAQPVASGNATDEIPY